MEAVALHEEEELDHSLPPPPPPAVNQDAVLRCLGQAETQYREQRASWEHQVTELMDAVRHAEAQLGNARELNRQLNQNLEASHRQLELEQQKARRHAERSKQLSSLLKEIHSSLLSGNVYSLILRACLTITGATRGLYVSVLSGGEKFRIRAAVDVDGYPQAPPSEFITALCRRALQERDSLVCSSPGDMQGLPQPSKPGEQFHNCIVAPVVVLKNLNGVIIAGDKLSGEFDTEDVETLLSVGDQAAVAVENEHLERELQRAYVSTVSMLADAVEAKDAYTGGHCEMVSRLARLIARRLNLPDQEQSIVCYAALLHDVGKIAVSDGILNKPGPLLPEERELVKSHVRVGHDLILNVPALQQVAKVVLHHHEWYDGNGYPDGLRGDDIPIGSRIVCAVDSYCAIVTKRSYKPAYSLEQARQELIRCSGAQFDPKVVEALLEILETPEGQNAEMDDGGECGILPGFGQMRHLHKAA